MTSRSLAGLAIGLAVLIAAPACQRDLTDLEEAEFPGNAEIFVDGYADGVTYQAFAGSKPDAVSVDQTVFYQGRSSLRIDVPVPSNPGGSYAGGAFTTNTLRDLTEYNAVTFWARASMPAELNVAGLGNNNTGESLYPAETENLQLTTDWQQYAIPFPLPSRLDQEDGLFFFAEGAEDGNGYTFWIDELKFADLTTISNPRPVIADQMMRGAVGDTVTVSGTTVTYEVSGQDITVAAAPAYFDFTSSDASVASVDELGQIVILAEGTADITASLGSVAATGTVTVTTESGAVSPEVAAPTPTQAEADVISMFSEAYTDVPVDTWRTEWSVATLEEVTIDGSAMKKYSALDVAGIETVSSQIDASGMTHLHLDIWTPDATFFAVKLVDFGPDGGYQGGDDTEFQVNFDGTANPAPAQGQWVSLDIPLSDFEGMNLANLAQMILVGQPTGATTVFVDNVYFYDENGGEPATEPTTAAPTPTQAEADVISMFSEAYTDVPVDTWRTEWSVATLEEVTIDGSAMKKYSALDAAGIETVSSQIDASGMTHFHLDIWTPDATFFAVKLVDFGPDGGYQGGDDTEFQVNFDGTANPVPNQGQWVSLDIPLSDFEGMNLANLAQMILVGQPTGATTVFVDNVYFYDESGTTGAELELPITFDDPAVDYALTDFGGTASTLVADPTDGSNTVAQTIKSAGAETWAGTTVGGDDGLATPVPFTASATTMTVRVYSPDAGIPVRLKVEDATDPARSVETEATTTVANAWETLTFDFSNEATGTAALNLEYTYDKASIFFNFGTNGATAGEKTYLWDDVEFGGESTSGPVPPAAPAPAPTQDAADVISIYSDSYTDVPNEGFARYGAVEFAEVDIAGSGNSALNYVLADVTGGNFGVLELGGANQIDAAAAGMTNFRFDLYFPNEVDASSELLLKLVDFGSDPATEAAITVDPSSTPAIAQGTWLSFDFTLVELQSLGLGGTSNIQQLVVDLVTSGEVYIDNIYFYAAEGTTGADLELPITFDDPAVDYALTDFGGTASTLVVDPTDGSNTVAQTIKSAGAETWAGTTVGGDDGLATPVPFTASATTMTVRVYSPDAGIPVRLKVEDATDPTRSVETEATTTVANAWETLTFDFSNEATGTAALNLEYTYDKASIFFNFGTNGATAGEKTYLWDDVSAQP